MTDFSICETPDVLSVVYFIKIIVNIIKVVIPIFLIVIVSFELVKGVANGEQKVEKILKINKNKILSAILIFSVPTIISIFLEIIDENTGYESCWVNADADIIKKYQILWDEEEENLNTKEEFDINQAFSKKITFNYIFENDGIHMPYALYIPSTAKKSTSLPLIVWLHGSGDGSMERSKIESRGLPCALSNWNLLNFNAIVLAPQITGAWNSRIWFTSDGKKDVDNIIAFLIKEYNIDTNRIIIAGHSNGGMGAIYMAAEDNNNYYSSFVSISGNTNVSLSDIKIPGRAYTGSISKGESSSNYNFAMYNFGSYFGEENVFLLDSSHIDTGKDAFLIDGDDDSKSDLIEWMFEQERKNQEKHEENEEQEEVVDGDVTNINTSKKPIKVTDNVSRNYYSTFTYYLYLPDKVVKNLPIVVYIPGLGSRGNDYSTSRTIGVKDGPIHEVLKHGYSYNAIIISMQVPSDSSAYLYVKKYIQLINKIADEFEANKNKISIIGFSNGCYGLLTAINNYPKYFSAAVPVGCSPANYNANKFIHQPVWTFVGGGDGYTEMPTFVSKINSLGGNAKHTYATREDGTPVRAHGIMNDSYSILREERYDIINWMISQTKNS